MTREEAREAVREAYDWGDPEYREEIIKALEQEPILDKIRAEIEQERVGYPPSADYYKAIMKCLQIIDKYKESEDKECR